MEIDDSKICLSCMSVRDVLDIYETHVCDGNEEVYADMLKKCFYIELIKESGLNGMCVDCVMRLRDAYYFRDEIIQTITALLAGESKYNIQLSDLESESQTDSDVEAGDNKTRQEPPPDPAPAQADVEVGDNKNQQEPLPDPAPAQADVDVGDNKTQQEPPLDPALTQTVHIPYVIEKEINHEKDCHNTRGKNGVTQPVDVSIVSGLSVKIEEIPNVDNPDRNPTEFNGLAKESQLKNVCNICGTNYDIPEALEEHLKTHYLLHCETCGKNFMNEKTLWNHIKTHINKPYYCTKCDKSFAKLSSLNNHLCRNREPYMCITCGQSFDTIQKCLRHAEIQHGTSMPKYACPHCEKNQFTSEVSLKKHMHLIHPEHCKNKCNICHKQFRFDSAVQVRLKTEGKLFLCMKCDKKFSHIKTLKEHSQTHINIQPEHPHSEETHHNIDIQETMHAVEEIIDDNNKYMTV